MTAPISSSLATAKPATSSHLMFGFSVTIAWASWSWSFLLSSLPLSFAFSFFLGATVHTEDDENHLVPFSVLQFSQYSFQFSPSYRSQYTDSSQLLFKTAPLSNISNCCTGFCFLLCMLESPQESCLFMSENEVLSNLRYHTQQLS